MATKDLGGASSLTASLRNSWRWRDRLEGLIMSALRNALRPACHGRLRITLPSGRSANFGKSSAGYEATLKLNNYAVFQRSLRRGTIGFAQSYMAGEIDTDDLHTLFRFFLDNRPILERAWGGQFRVRARDRWQHAARRNSRRGSRRNISAHYDLGNEFYQQWLDVSLTYSSAYFSHDDQLLEAAQNEKYQRILTALALEPGHSLLEVGCGWGRFAELAAGVGAAVTGVTISRQQHAAARARIDAAGLSQSVDIRFEDYRDIRGTFDRVASIEMIEAVGEENWPTYFGALASRLRPGGVAVLQAITIDDALFERYRRKPDFIQQYIFPGGMLPTADIIRREAERAGLSYERVLSFGPSYAQTLAEWRRRFEVAWPRIAAQGFDEQFRRMWLYYLAYCEQGFSHGTVDVGLYRLRKPANAG